MIEPTDAVSDESWDEPEPTSDGLNPNSNPTSAGTAPAERDSLDAASPDADDADDDEMEDGELAGEDDGELAGDDDAAQSSDETAARKRRRRRKPPEAPLVPDARAQQALDFVAKVVLEMEMDCHVKLRRPKNEDDVDEVNIEIIGKDAGRIIGKKGSVLQAIQFLTHRVINRPGLDRRHVLVDAEGYRSRRDNSLATMARRLGKQAVDQGKIITFEPMNPRDRRVVHLALAKFEGVITKSDGEGDDRRVQIIPVRR
jgi:spoIIIJ-associated protein